MEWNNNDENKEKGSKIITRLILAIICCIVLIIMVLIAIIMTSSSTQTTGYSVLIDGKNVDISSLKNLFIEIEDKTYVNLEQFAKLIGYEFHRGEYKAYTIEEDKCYVQSKYETATFYLNDAKIYKLPINQSNMEYDEFLIDNPVKAVGGVFYIPLSALETTFNIQINQEENKLSIISLDYLIQWYNKKVKEWGYTSIEGLSFENKKLLLQGRIIVCRENGLYKIIDVNNTKEIIPEKYKNIEFSELNKEFYVTNNMNQVGILNFDGSIKIEPAYESVSVLDKEEGLYLIKKDEKYGVVKKGNISIIFPEYDSIGYNNTTISNKSNNPQLLLDTLIPVRKNSTWGAFDKSGRMIYKIEYESFGFKGTVVEINNIKKSVLPILTIERCNGVVVKKEGKYGLLDVTGKELVPIAVDAIYEIGTIEDEENRYFMIYNGNELNVIERLVKAGLIEEKNENGINNGGSNNLIANNIAE